MAILGYNTKGSTLFAFATGRRLHAPFVLASAQTMTELHGWFADSGASGLRFILSIYADSAGAPGARLAYTSPIVVPVGPIDLSQAGFSVALAAGTYWIGVNMETGGTAGLYYDTSGGAGYKGDSSGMTFNPPDDPYGSTSLSNSVRALSVWAVVGAAVVSPKSGFLAFT